MKKFVTLLVTIVCILVFNCIVACAEGEIDIPLVFNGTLNETLTIEGNDYQVDSQHPYVIVVPSTINVVPESATAQTITDNSKKVWVAGYTINPVSVSVKSASITMTSNKQGVASKTAIASLSTVTLPFNIEEAKYYSNPLSVKWSSGNTPAFGSGTWTGTVEYTIS